MRQPSKLTRQHQDYLEGGGINPQYASEVGVFSALNLEDLPDSLRDWADFALPAIVFPLRHINGNITWQMRPDNPPLNSEHKPLKYLQEKGSGTIITVPEDMAERVGEAKTLLIVEGTKQTLAATQAATDATVIVVGIQGCEGWRQDGGLHEDIQDLISQGIEEVEILFDQDIATNVNVWNAASSLRQQLSLTAGVEPKRTHFIQLPPMSGGKEGLDDYLATVRPEQRREALARLRQTRSKLPGKPRTTKTNGAQTTERYEVRMAAAEVVKIKRGQGDDDDTEQVVLNAAAEIRRVEYVMDEETKQVVSKTLILDVNVRGEDGRVATHSGVRVADRNLERINDWLAPLPGAFGVQVGRFTYPQDEIGAAIRSSSTRIEPTGIIKRFGWYLDAVSQPPVWVYALPHESYGPNGLHDALVGRPPQKQFQQIQSQNVYAMDTQSRQEAIRELFDTRFLFRQPSQWLVALAVVGLAFLPITPMAAVGFFGPKSSGKSTLAQGMSTVLNPAWAPPGSPMATFNATESALGIIANGIENCFLHVDDLRPGASRRKSEDTMEALDSLLRRSYGATGKQRGTFDRDTNEVGVAATDTANPLVVITGEKIPTGDMADSGLDRLFVVEMEPHRTFTPQLRQQFDGDVHDDGGSAALNSFQALARHGVFQVAGQLYLAHLAQMLNPADVGVDPVEHFDKQVGRLEESRSRLSDTIESLYGQTMRHARVSTRAITLIGSLQLGLASLLEFAISEGVVNDSESDQMLAEFTAAMISGTLEHTESVMGGNQSAADELLDQVRNIVSDRSASVDPDNVQGATRLIGKVAMIDGQKALLLNHAAVAKLLQYPGGPRGVVNALKTVSLKDSEGKATRAGRIGNARLRCVAIPIDIWDPSWDEQPDEASEAMF